MSSLALCRACRPFCQVCRSRALPVWLLSVVSRQSFFDGFSILLPYSCKPKLHLRGFSGRLSANAFFPGSSCSSRAFDPTLPVFRSVGWCSPAACTGGSRWSLTDVIRLLLLLLLLLLLFIFFYFLSGPSCPFVCAEQWRPRGARLAFKLYYETDLRGYIHPVLSANVCAREL